MKLSKTIQRIRVDQGLTLKEVSERSGVQVATLSRIENGKSMGTIKALDGIATAFGMKLSELIAESEN